MEDKYFKYIAFGLGIIALILFTAFIYKNFSPPMPENRDAFSQHPGEAVLNNVPNPPLNISGCNTKESCIDYCSYPENARKCLTFLTRRGVNPYVLPDAPGLCQNKEQCEAYCMENFAECEYYKAYEKGIVSGVFDNNYSDIIIPVPSQNQTVKFYKIASSHFGDKNIGREFERFKSMGINSYSFGGGGSYLMGGEFVNDMGIYKEKSANEYGFETRASYYIGKSHLNGFKFVYSTGPTDWDLWYSQQYKNPSQELVEGWLKNYTKAIREISQFSQKTNVDVLAIGVDSAMIKIDRTEDKGYLHSVYEKFLREMLKESRKWYSGKIGMDFGNSVDGMLEFERIPDIGKLDYVLFTTTAKPLDESDPSEWAQQTLRAIEEAKKIAEKNNAEGIILLYEFEEFGQEQPCRSNEQYSEETRIKLYNDLLNATKEHVVGFMPVSTPLFACDSENLLKVTEEWYKKHL